jgi:L-ascorbate metabolism protein UlaG (beta-lactamase superfamily)
MELKYLGHSSFLIKSKDGKLVTDPFDSSIGIPFPKTDADVVTISHSHPDHANLKGISGEPLVVDWPGEYEKKGIRIFGYGWYHDDKKGEERGENILYKIDVDDISILHAGDLGSIPPDSFIDEIGTVDILLVPVGGSYTVDAKTAMDFAKKIDPSIVVPMHFNNDKLNQETFGKLSGVDEFLKQFGTSPEPVEKLTLKKGDLGEEDMKVVVMSF